LKGNLLTNRLKRWARGIKQDLWVVYLAVRDPRTPWYVKLITAIIVAYALSPIDLIPDFVPVLGYLDDLIIVPLGLLLIMRLLPIDVLADCRAKAAEGQRAPPSYVAAFAIVVLSPVKNSLWGLWVYPKIWN